MEKVIRAMMDMIAYEVCGKSIDKAQYILSDEELMELYKLSKYHDLAHLVGDALIKNDLISDGEIKSKFEKQIMTAVYRYERIHYELTQIKAILNVGQIPYIPLKGSVIRSYYPEPWMRTSCDIDILVHEGDLERGVKLLMDQCSYKEENKGPHDIGLFSPNNIHLELHYTLIEESRAGTMGKILESVWDHAMPVADTAEYALSDEMFYYYHIAHMAKHFRIGGCGVRPFLDIWILNHRISYDKEKREALLQASELLKFARQAECLAEVWFGHFFHTDTTYQMENYLLHGGVYGNVENRVAVQQNIHGGKFRYALSRLFLPYETIKFHYPVLEKHKWLLPFCEIRRWCKLLFCGGLKRSVRELSCVQKLSKSQANSIEKFLNEIGL